MEGSTYTLTGLLCSFTTFTFVDVLAIVAHDDIAAVRVVLVYMVDITKADLLGESNTGNTGTLAGWGGLQNSSVSIRNSVHKTHGERHGDDGGDGGVDAIKKQEERAERKQSEE